jgi:hypothetical protein
MRLKSAVCDTEVMVIKAPDDALEVTCGGAPLLDAGAPRAPGAAIAAGEQGGTLIGKRYVDRAGDLELLCTKPGSGSLAARGERLDVKSAKPLPSSD